MNINGANQMEFLRKSRQHYSLVNIAALPLANDTTSIYSVDIIIVFNRLVVILVRGLLLIAV
jgi:hypothetical protein